MWKTSLIQFFKIIRQNKFFTFLNLFGISITILIILIAALKIESTVWPGGPEKNNDMMLFITNEEVSNENNVNIGGINRMIIEDYITRMKTPKAMAFGTGDPWSYFGEQGVEDFSLRYVNAGWWQVYDYQFIKGRPFGPQEVDDATPVIVINERVKNRFFPNHEATGQMLEILGKMYKITGVIKDIPSNCTHSYADVFIPVTLSEKTNSNLRQTGAFELTFLGTDKENLAEIKSEFETVRRRILPEMDEGYNLYFGGPDTALEYYLRDWNGPRDYVGHTTKMMNILGRFLLVMLLPAINLISIQLIRIYERSEEIGVRKAFGATRGRLIRQIMYENTLLSFVGAILGLVLTLLVIYGFHDFIARVLFSDIGENVSLKINFALFLVCLVASLLLSLISGIIPAIKMSRLEPVDVLKGGKI